MGAASDYIPAAIQTPPVLASECSDKAKAAIDEAIAYVAIGSRLGTLDEAETFMTVGHNLTAVRKRLG